MEIRAHGVLLDEQFAGLIVAKLADGGEALELPPAEVLEDDAVSELFQEAVRPHGSRPHESLLVARRVAAGASVRAQLYRGPRRAARFRRETMLSRPVRLGYNAAHGIPKAQLHLRLSSERRCGKGCRAQRLGASQARPRRHLLRQPSRPLWHNPGRRRRRRGGIAQENRGRAQVRVLHRRRRPRARAPRLHGQQGYGAPARSKWSRTRSRC